MFLDAYRLEEASDAQECIEVLASVVRSNGPRQLLAFADIYRQVLNMWSSTDAYLDFFKFINTVLF